MRRSLPVFFSLFLIFVALAETTHTHEQSCDAPCAAVCLGSSCGVYCDNSGAKSLADPKDSESREVFNTGSLFIVRLPEDEIFHPPLG
ncbi:MAG: hypothetical protein Q7R35_03925 [Elusimicrobiota bacterium]|nr:hypothetical protein [Elusimicrobiota bacterium]